MATIKVKFRHSNVDGKQGSIYYQVIHRRIPRQIKTAYKLFPAEWDAAVSEIVSPLSDEQRRRFLLDLRYRIREDVSRIRRIFDLFDRKRIDYTADDVVAAYRTLMSRNTLFIFMHEVISLLCRLGKIRTSETYADTLRSFSRFRRGEDLLLDELDSDLVRSYEAYLRRRQVTRNTSSFYMRVLRAVYNRAVDNGLTEQRYPFKHVYTGVEKTVKRAVSLEAIRRIKALELSGKPSLDFARDLFLFSFYTRGMSFVDMAFLKKTDLKDDVLVYRRRKTGRSLWIKWEDCMQSVIKKHDFDNNSHLLPIIKVSDCNLQKQYKNASNSANKSLKIVGKMAGLAVPLTMYVARHSWASIAKSKNIPISVISESMGHDSEVTTQIYLASLDTSVVDKANRLILNLI